MNLGDVFPRLAGEEEMSIRDADDPAPRLSRLLDGDGGMMVGERAQAMRQAAGGGGSATAQSDGGTAQARAQQDDLSPEERRQMKLQVTTEFLTEINEMVAQIDFQEQELDEAPSPEDIRSELGDWALALARTFAIPARRTNAPLEDLSDEERRDLLRIGRNLQNQL